MNFVNLTYRTLRWGYRSVSSSLQYLISIMLLKANLVSFGRGLKSNGIPYLDISPFGKMSIGENFKMNNGGRYNMIGRQQKCCFVVSRDAALLIGQNVGMSAVAIICSHRITIGNNVKIGGNTVIYDTDFHSTDYLQRKNRCQDVANRKSAAVFIGDDVFIGAHTTILKGVKIGSKSIVGAGSVVTKDIPEDEIWAGNPARLIKPIRS
ncbi:acyltransferase [Pedobacter sp. KLB.chiD]|uniref:acyltransferase n=1 Tax=Pedobacter sp. KLB.chiD TaxID=3387402 RepID=UPI00399B6AD3